ncbi:sensor histidine kinase [Paenibacillus caui]|uniref:sensor histidine kinase n=1 Tax=Paenibacillus caui TaxID=2873927 RepID=UPI001F2A59A0|nr:HAMP domain-containing sensor histidine kinase [Paenibacillus caui]
MNVKWFRAIRFKFLVMFISSIFLAMMMIAIFQTVLIRQFIPSIEAEYLEQQYSLIYMGFFLILTTILFYRFSKKTLVRLEKINKSVNMLQEGQLDIHIPVTGDDEIGKLAGNINKMVSRLKAAIEKEQKSEQMKNEMISSISHDLRTPLTSLIGYIELIKTNIGSNIEACHHYAETSYRKCNELKKLIEDLLEYCHIQFKGMKMNKEAVSLKPLIEQVMIDFVPLLEEAGMSFEIETEERTIEIFADISLMVRLLQNIVSNSISYGRHGKKITIKLLTENTKVVIQVVNYGKEISPDHLPHIFDRYYRAEESGRSHTAGQGMGMGLAIAKSIAEAHDGIIEVKSSEIQTAFSIVLNLHGQILRKL